MLGRVLIPASRLARVHGQRALLARASVNTNTVTVSRAGSDVAHHEQLTPRQEDEMNLLMMDLLPTPTVPWAKGISEQQAYYNSWLYAGALIMVATIGIGYLLDRDMYWLAPDYPQKNPAGFSLAQMKAEALAKLDADGGDDEE